MLVVIHSFVFPNDCPDQLSLANDMYAYKGGIGRNEKKENTCKQGIHCSSQQLTIQHFELLLRTITMTLYKNYDFYNRQYKQRIK